MAAKRSVRWMISGAALLALGACDQVQTRMDAFGELVERSLAQLSGEAAEPEDPLAAAPLEARALFGVQQAPVEIQVASLEEMLSTQSYFAVGSVIAKPREDMVEPVVEPDSFDLAAATPEAGVTPETVQAAEDAAAESAEIEAGPPVVESTTEQAVAAPEPGAPPAVELEPPGAKDSPNLQRALKSAPVISAPELRRKVEMAPRVLERDIKESGVRINREALRTARQTAEQSIKADTESAQMIGDEIARKAADKLDPVPKALAVRSKLNVDRALVARERAYSKLEELGLSGVVTPEEGGQMRITIAVKPTQAPLGQDLAKVQTMRDLFAPARKPEETCAGDPSAEQMQQDAVLATECVVKLLQETGDYEYVEKDYIFSNQMLRKPKSKPATALGLKPNDPLFGLQWHFKDNGAAAGQSAGGAGFSNFWNRAKLTGSRSVTVAIVDTGLQMNHPDIAGSKNLAPGFDMVSDPMMGNDGDGRDTDPNDPGDKCDPADPTARDTFHGTHVAGTVGVAATNNASGIAGGAWDVTIVPVRALGRCGGRLSDINDAIRWAAGRVPGRDAQGGEVWNSHPADIINLSIGLFEPCPASMQAAIDDAVAAGAVVVAAAGNARIDTKYFAPGGCRNVIAVAAGDARGVLTPYSNFGANVAIMAPGGDMTRDDDGDGRPDGVLSTKFSTDCYDPAKPGVQVAQCYYAYENGTSMAAPHVAAALALLKAKFPSAVPSELRTRLLAASTARAPLQCSGKCSNYPGTEPIPGQDGMCFRPCGGAMLNLANAAVQ